MRKIIYFIIFSCIIFTFANCTKKDGIFVEIAFEDSILVMKINRGENLKKIEFP